MNFVIYSFQKVECVSSVLFGVKVTITNIRLTIFLHYGMNEYE